MSGLTWSGCVLDRRLLVELERPVWDSLAVALQQRLTDSVSDGAVHRMPAEYYARNGAELARALKRRRDQLPEAARRYYALLARVVDVHGMRQPELVQVERGADGAVAVRMARRDEGSSAPGVPYYHGTFQRGETEEVRLYLGGGGDRLVARGPGAGQIVVRVISGGAGDELVDSSAAGVRVYDAPRTARVVRGPGTTVGSPPGPLPTTDGSGTGSVTRLGGAADSHGTGGLRHRLRRGLGGGSERHAFWIPRRSLRLPAHHLVELRDRRPAAPGGVSGGVPSGRLGARWRCRRPRVLDGRRAVLRLRQRDAGAAARRLL